MSQKQQQCDIDIDLEALGDWTRPLEWLRCELWGLRLMATDFTPLQKLHTTIFILFWMLWTGAWLAGMVDPHPVLIIAYALVTGVASGIYVRMHKIELEKMTRLFEEGVTISLGDSPSDEDDED